VIGFFGGIILMNLIFILFARTKPAKTNKLFRRIQMVSSAFMAFSHGSNDAQKTMGIMTLALISAGKIPGTPFVVPFWVILLSACAMALGTAGGGWKIIKTMGSRLVNLTPAHGFAAETAAATLIETASRFGFPLSTTHVISSTILGVGASRRIRSVRWNIATNIIRAWIFTIPASAFFAFVSYKLILIIK
jgi:PiT family inorganic phosphate transporter